MAPSRRTLSAGFWSFIFVASSFIVLTHAQAAAPPDTTRITAAANITLRSMPSPDAPPIAQLPLGTEVTDAGPAGLDKKWVRVKLADNREGWLLSNLTRPLDPVWRWPTFDRIITERLGRKGDGFPAAIELVAFIERVAPEYTDPDGRGRIELARLRALSAAAALIPMSGGRRAPYAPWLDARKAEVIYDEPGGHWMLSDTLIWQTHAKQSATTSADDIAWLAVTNGLAGECEGQLTCYLAVRNRLHGEYLRRHPMGRHAAEAVAVLKETAEILAAPQKPHATYDFDKKRDCRDLTSSVDALATAVQKTHVAGKDAAITALRTLTGICTTGTSGTTGTTGTTGARNELTRANCSY